MSAETHSEAGASLGSMACRVLLLALFLPLLTPLFLAIGIPIGLTEALPAMQILLLLAAALAAAQWPAPQRISPATLFFMTWAMWLCAFTPNASQGHAAFLKIHFILLALFLSHLLDIDQLREELIKSFSRWFPILLSLVLLFGLAVFFLRDNQAFIQRATNDSMVGGDMRETMQRALAQHRLLTLFGNPNQLAALICMGLPFAIVGVRHTKGKIRWINILMVVVMAIALLCTKSRGGLLAASAVSLLLAFRGDLGFHLGRRGRVVMIAGVMGMLALIIAIGGPRLKDTETIKARGEFWRVAATLIQQQPLQGYGPEGYWFHYSQHRFPGGVEAKQVHNLPLEAAVEGGAIAALWAMALLVWLAALGFSASTSSSVAAARVAAAVFGMQCLWDFHNNIAVLLFYFALLAALSARPLRPPRWLSSALLILALLATAVMAFSGMRWFGDARGIAFGIAALAVLATALPAVWLNRRVQSWLMIAAMAVLVWYFGFMQHLSGVYEMAGKLHWQDGEPVHAQINFEHAIRLTPSQPNSYASLGVLKSHFKEYPGAVDNLKRAISLSPRSAHMHSTLAGIYIEMKRYDDAEREALLAANLHPARAKYRAQLAEIYRAKDNMKEAERQIKWAGILPEQVEKGSWLYPNLPRGQALKDTLPGREDKP
jgi:tetratricopeptide (TPR) repeat protein